MNVDTMSREQLIAKEEVRLLMKYYRFIQSIGERNTSNILNLIDYCENKYGHDFPPHDKDGEYMVNCKICGKVKYKYRI